MKSLGITLGIFLAGLLLGLTFSFFSNFHYDTSQKVRIWNWKTTPTAPAEPEKPWWDWSK